MRRRGVSMLEVLMSATLMAIVGGTFYQTMNQSLDDMRLSKEDIDAIWLTINASEWMHMDRTSETGTGALHPWMDTDANSIPFETKFSDLIKDSGTGKGFRIRFDRFGYTRYCCGATDLAAYGMCMENSYLWITYNTTGVTWQAGGYWWMAECDTSRNSRGM